LLEIDLHKRLDTVAKELQWYNKVDDKERMSRYISKLEDLASIKSDNCKRYIINRLMDLHTHVEYKSQRLINSILEIKYLHVRDLFKPEKIAENISEAHA
jgi:hypothetical protein